MEAKCPSPSSHPYSYAPSALATVRSFLETVSTKFNEEHQEHGSKKRAIAMLRSALCVRLCGRSTTEAPSISTLIPAILVTVVVIVIVVVAK